MSQQFRSVCEDPSPSKKRKLGQVPKLESIILECRSVRIGTLRRMVTKPVIVRSVLYSFVKYYMYEFKMYDAILANPRASSKITQINPYL